MATILIIDNDPAYVESITTLLQTQGHTVLSAHDGDEGFGTAYARHPDCVLLDVMMRHVSEGLDVATRLRDTSATQSIPVILITGIRKPEHLTESYQEGGAFPNIRAMIEKPFKPEVLLQHLQRILG